MKQMPPINHIVHSPPTVVQVVPSPPTAVQVVPEVAVLRDGIYMIVDHLKWIEKLVCVYSCCSVYSTNEVDVNVSVSRCI
jgi:hypothetical protein